MLRRSRSFCVMSWLRPTLSPSSRDGRSQPTASTRRCRSTPTWASRSTTFTTCSQSASSFTPSRTATTPSESSTACGGPYPVSSTTTSPIRERTSTSLCIQRSWAPARGRLRCRSAPTRCTERRSTASRRTGDTRRAGHETPRSRSASPGCVSCSTGSARPPRPRSSSSTSSQTSSTIRFSSSPPRAR